MQLCSNNKKDFLQSCNNAFDNDFKIVIPFTKLGVGAVLAGPTTTF